jgi:hypothetical protein
VGLKNRSINRPQITPPEVVLIWLDVARPAARRADEENEKAASAMDWGG